MGLFSSRPAVSTDEAKIEELLTRGVAEAISKDKLREKLRSGKRLRVKLGIDPTSSDLHIGRAIPLLKLRDFQELGHQVVFIVGDFTAVIGDTSDKDAERPMLTRADVDRNKKTYMEQVGKLINISHAEFRSNSEWLSKLSYTEVGEQADAFSVSDFISRENIRRRLDGGKRVSLREVLYPLMQGYDSVAIEADVELGGTDQKFNLLAGRTMQEKYKQRPQDIVMNPLIEGLDGRKMSSSWGNTITLNAAPSDMYGKVMSMGDAQIPTYLELCTRVPMNEVKEIAGNLADGTLHPKEAKMRLAREIVTLYHGKSLAKTAEDDWQATFSEGGVPADAPHITVAKGTPLREALKDNIESMSELRRLVAQGAVAEVGGEGRKFDDINMPLERDMALRIGKHRFVRITVQ